MILVRYSLAAKALATCLVATPACAPGMAQRAQDQATHAPTAAAVQPSAPTATD